MKAVVTNLGKAAVPISSSDGEGFAAMIEPDAAYTLDNDATVVTVGDNPSFKEDVVEALQNIAAIVARFVSFWREHQDTVAKQGGKVPTVHIHIDNVDTAHGLRVRQGDDVSNDLDVESGAQVEAEALDYIELRQTGGWNPVEGTP